MRWTRTNYVSNEKKARDISHEVGGMGSLTGKLAADEVDENELRK